MRRHLALCALFGALTWAQTVSKMATVHAWLPDQTIAAMQANGVVFDGGGHYQVLQGRFVYWLDGGLLSQPQWPGAVILSQAAPTLCSSSFLCNWNADGGVDVAVAQSSGCFCADATNTCLATNPLGIASQVAPKGITLPGSGWSNPGGPGCVPMPSCVALWTNLPDGGPDTPWSNLCPLQ